MLRRMKSKTKTTHVSWTDKSRVRGVIRILSSLLPEDEFSPGELVSLSSRQGLLCFRLVGHFEFQFLGKNVYNV